VKILCLDRSCICPVTAWE